MLSRTIHRSLATSTRAANGERASINAPRLTGYLAEMLRNDSDSITKSKESGEERRPRSSDQKFRSQKNAKANKSFVRDRRTSTRRAKDGDNPRFIADNLYATTIPEASIPKSFEVDRNIYKMDAMSLQNQLVDQVSDSQVESEVTDGDYSRYVLDGSSDNTAVKIASSALSRNASIDVVAKNSVLSTIKRGVSG